VLSTTGTGTLTWATPSGGVPYTGATQAVDLGAYDLKVNGLTVGRGNGNIDSNTAIGERALSSNTTGTSNIANGNLALASNTTGNYNTATGFAALLNNTTGSSNVASGFAALSANTTGDTNLASGNYTLASNTTGTANLANGHAALSLNTSGANNTAVGYNSLSVNTTGVQNTAIGDRADVGSGALTNATAIGAGAIVNASDNIQLGNTSVTDVKTFGTLTAGAVTYPNSHGAANQVLSTTGTGTLTWATPSGGVPYTGATQAVDLGAYNLKVNGLTVGRGNGNIASNTAIGEGTLASNTTGDANTATGYIALYNNTTGTQNTASGMSALYANTTGAYNTATGYGALSSNTEGLFNTANGYVALASNTTGFVNQASGNYALNANTTGNSNSASGYSALRANTTGSNNTASGYNALDANTTGSNNTAIGYYANVGSAALTNATAIGYGATVNASNTIQLGNTDVAKVITSGTLTAGTVTYPNTAGTNGQVLTTDGSGIASWASAPTYSVGLNPGLGGYVFYVTPDGKHGLVAETIDQFGASDFPLESFYISSQGKAIDNIMDPAKHSAAGANFTDWRLPTRFEMLLMYNTIGPGASGSNFNIGNFNLILYLTATLRDDYTQIGINFSTGNSDRYYLFGGSSSLEAARAVRSF
jgi:hypothetical protein